MGNRTKSSKAKKERSDDESEIFTGGKDGISWHEFDSIMGDWLLDNYGSRFGEQLWSDNWIDLMKLDLSDDTDEYEYEQYKSMVRDVLTEKSPKMAEMTIKNKAFKTIKWHLQWRVRQHEKLYLQLKKTTDGEAHRLVNEAGYKNMNGVRNKLMMRFANIQSAQLKERQKLYMLGMPSSPGRPMFEDDCNMEKVLDKMEKMRKYLYDMCPKEERASNEYAKESTLVRIISDNLPPQYEAAWDRLELQMTMRKLAAGESGAGKLDSATDTINKSFSSNWLPPYQDVRVVLVDHYYKLLKTKKQHKSKGREKLPVMMLPEGNEITCYACGEPGHKSNDPACNASRGQVWSGAPSAFKAKVSENKSPKSYEKGAGGRDNTCHNFAKDGWCRYGDNCRFDHKSNSKRANPGGKGKGKGKGKGRGGNRRFKKKKPNPAGTAMLIEENQSSSSETRATFNLLAGGSDTEETDHHSVLMIGCFESADNESNVTGNETVNEYPADKYFTCSPTSWEEHYTAFSTVARMKGGCPSPDPEHHNTTIVESSSSENEEDNIDIRVVFNNDPNKTSYREFDCGDGETVRIGHNSIILPTGEAGPHIFEHLFGKAEGSTVMLLQQGFCLNDEYVDEPKGWSDLHFGTRWYELQNEKRSWSKSEVLSMIHSAEIVIQELLNNKLHVLHSHEELQASITQYWESVSKKPTWASRCLKHFDDELAKFMHTSQIAHATIEDYFESQKFNGLITQSQYAECCRGYEEVLKRQIDINDIFGSMDEYKSFMGDKGYIVNQQGNIIKLSDAEGIIPVDSDEGNSNSNGSSSIENDDDGRKDPDGPSESGKNGKWEAVDDADGRRDKRNREDPFRKKERQVENGFKSALLVIRPINEDSHLSTEDLRLDDPICGIWIINTTTPFYHQLLQRLTDERRIFAVVKELEEAQDFYHWRDGMLLTRREENPPFTRREDCEQPRQLNVDMTKILMGYTNCSYQGERKRKRLWRTANEDYLIRHTDTMVLFTFEEDKRIGTETFMFSGYHQNFLSAYYHAVTRMNYMFKGNFLTPDGESMWETWFDNYTLSRDDITVEYGSGIMNNVTVTEEGVFIITDDSRNANLRMNVKLNPSAYNNMLEGRVLQSVTNMNVNSSQSSSATVLPENLLAESEGNDSEMNGKEEAE